MMAWLEVAIFTIATIAPLISIGVSITILSKRRYEEYARKKLEHDEQKQRVREAIKRGKADE